MTCSSRSESLWVIAALLCWPVCRTTDGRAFLRSEDSNGLQQTDDDYYETAHVTTEAAEAAAENGPYRGAAEPIVTVARSERPDDTPCPSVEGLWLSSNLETVFQVTATAMASRLDLRAVDSDWTGVVEALFGDGVGGGPVSAVISKPDTGAAATFVGNCRTENGADHLTGIWVLAIPVTNNTDYHLALQPIPDTLHRLGVGYSN